MRKQFTPINILLIEDNPALEGIKAKDLKERGIDIGDLDDNIDVPGINFKNKNTELHQLFRLKILQHPEEIREFISNCLEKEDKEGSLALGNIRGVVPEIVEFDYKLGDNFQINSEEGENNGRSRIKYWSKYKKLREYYNPNFLFKNEQFLEKKENENYRIEDFIKRINNNVEVVTEKEGWFKKDIKDLTERDDELGLYSGVEITRLFRNHVCIGIPATFNFDLRERLHAFGKFYEWMNEYDLGSMFSRKERNKKDWDSLITAAVKQLRVRIEAQLQSNKITLALPQLLAWISDVPNEKQVIEQQKRIFTFQSAYGVRHLPLDGLFIDVDVNDRDNAIKNWVKSILSTYQRNISTISEAIEKYNKIYGVFQEHFTNRILLSYFAKKEQDILELTAKITSSSDTDEINRLQAEVDNLTYFFTKNDNEYEDKYNWLKNDVFKVVNGEITNSKVLCGVKQEYSSFTGNNKKVFPTHEARLVVLFLVTRLWIDYQITNEEKPLYNLDEEDYYNVLNPVVSNNKTGVVLHMHCHKGELSLSYYMDTFQKRFMKKEEYFRISKNSNVWSFDWIEDGEKQILNSLFQDKLSKLTNRPEWLR